MRKKSTFGHRARTRSLQWAETNKFLKYLLLLWCSSRLEGVCFCFFLVLVHFFHQNKNKKKRGCADCTCTAHYKSSPRSFAGEFGFLQVTVAMCMSRCCFVIDDNLKHASNFHRWFFGLCLEIILFAWKVDVYYFLKLEGVSCFLQQER